MKRVPYVVYEGEDGFVSQTLGEVDIASQGKTCEEAIAMLQEALELYFEELPKKKKFLPETHLGILEVAA